MATLQLVGVLAVVVSIFVVVVSIFVVVVGVLVVAGGTATAGDAAGIFVVSPETLDVEPGEVVEVEVVLHTDGDYGGEGLYTYEYTLAYHPEYVTVTDVEHDPWFEADDDDVVKHLDREDGSVTVHHQLSDPGNGDVGIDTTATFTVEIAEDAPPSNVVLDITEAAGTYTSRMPMATFPVEGTLVVDGGGEEIRPETDGETGTEDDDLGITTPEGDGTPTPTATETPTDAVTPTDRDDGDAVAVPGFGLVAVLVGLAVLLPTVTRRC